jgi:Protein of unknown function (DUF2987)
MIFFATTAGNWSACVKAFGPFYSCDQKPRTGLDLAHGEGSIGCDLFRAMKLSTFSGFGRLAAFAILLTCFVEHGSGASPDARAVIPYGHVAEYCQFADGVDASKIAIRVSIESTNQSVKPSEIALTIRSAAKGEIPVPLAADGLLVHFPQTKELREEKPDVVSNQPKGSLRMSVTMRLPMADTPAFRYSRLEDGVTEINRAIKERAGWLSFVTPKAKGVKFYFPKPAAGKAKVEISSASGTKEYVADKDGEVKFKLEKSLLSENPEVKVSEKPTRIIPDIDCGGDESWVF